MKISGEIHVFHRDYQAAVYGISTLEVYEWALNYPSGRPIKELVAITAIDIQKFMNSREGEYRFQQYERNLSGSSLEAAYKTVKSFFRSLGYGRPVISTVP